MDGRVRQFSLAERAGLVHRRRDCSPECLAAHSNRNGTLNDRFPSEVRMKHIDRLRHNSIFFLLLTMINAGSLTAQSGTSSAISGTVVDPTGAPLAHASVVATEADTKVARD